jgi:hypothetical protein
MKFLRRSVVAVALVFGFLSGEATNAASAQEKAVGERGGRQKTFTLSVQAVIDGSDELHIDANGARWVHKHWGWPTQVALGDVAWNPSIANELPNSGATAFLPAGIDFNSAQLSVIQGQDTVAMERTANSVVVYLADTPNGAATYSFQITFALKRARNSSPPKYNRTTTLHIRAIIDGSDVLYISAKGAVWTHKHWGWPGEVTLNGVDWNPALGDTLVNSASTRFLERVKFSTARVTSREGADTVAIMPQKNGVSIFFADNPPGASVYNLTIEFNR